MISVDYVKPENLKPAPWRTTYIFAPDLKLLEASLLDFGWVAPLVVRASDSMIIDGFSRWLIASRVHQLTPIPVVWVKCDDADAVIMHIRLNRSRGEVIAKLLSAALQLVLKTDRYKDSDLARILGMTLDEFDILADGSLIKARNIKEHAYSEAWVPVETPSKSSPVEIRVERPPNDDQA